MPPICLTHLMRLTDDTGLLQHAYYGMPRRSEGYSADDNARGLMLMARRFTAAPEDRLVDLATIYVSFLSDAQDARGHFRNFMNYDRRWSDTPSSEDCQGRCLWALAEVMASRLPENLRTPAGELLTRGLGQFEVIYAPRATAFFLLAVGALPDADRQEAAERLARAAAERLFAMFNAVANSDWVWFEHYMTYANARLPHAMFATARLFGRPDYLDAGRRALDFLIRETIRDSRLHPVGNRGWYPRGGAMAEFDQQPIEAMAMVEAALAAHRATGDRRYADAAALAGRWFTGGNCLGVDVADTKRGSCHDGLGPDGVNRNQGAESTLAFLISHQALEDSGLFS